MLACPEPKADKAPRHVHNANDGSGRAGFAGADGLTRFSLAWAGACVVTLETEDDGGADDGDADPAAGLDDGRDAGKDADDDGDEDTAEDASEICAPGAGSGRSEPPAVGGAGSGLRPCACAGVPAIPRAAKEQPTSSASLHIRFWDATMFTSPPSLSP